jgi:acetyl esterase/lipase
MGTKGRGHRLVVLLALTAAALLSCAPAGAKTKLPKPRKGPAGLAFYKPPKKLPKGHGEVVWFRAAAPKKAVPGVKSTRRLLYTSTSPQGRRIAVSGYVSVPRGKPPRGGWPVIAWAHGTTGIADKCAPSRYLDGGPSESFVREWVAAGYAVASTDYPGLGTPGIHPYLVGKSEGRGILDIVRASRRLERSIGRRFVIAGASQGGQSALFAGSLARRWTPELRLRGTLAYAPGSHLYEQKNLLPALTGPSPLSAVAALILAGAVTTSKALKPESILTGPALALYPEVDTKCLPELSLSDSFGGLAPSTLIRSDADTSVLDEALKAMNPAVRIHGPVVLAQGSADATAFPFYTVQLRGELEARGSKVRYWHYEGVDHGGIVDAARADSLAFFKRRLPRD